MVRKGKEGNSYVIIMPALIFISTFSCINFKTMGMFIRFISWFPFDILMNRGSIFKSGGKPDSKAREGF